MKRLIPLFASLITFSSHALADITAYKSKEGIVLLSATPGQHFSIQIKGSKFEAPGDGSSPNPMFRVDG